MTEKFPPSYLRQVICQSVSPYSIPLSAVRLHLSDRHRALFRQLRRAGGDTVLHDLLVIHLLLTQTVSVLLPFKGHGHLSTGPGPAAASGRCASSPKRVPSTASRSRSGRDSSRSAAPGGRGRNLLLPSPYPYSRTLVCFQPGINDIWTLNARSPPP